MSAAPFFPALERCPGCGAVPLEPCRPGCLGLDPLEAGRRISDGREILRELQHQAATHGELSGEDAWGDVAGNAWRLLEDARDLVTLNRDGELSLTDLELWEGEVEDLRIDAGRLPTFNDN